MRDRPGTPMMEGMVTTETATPPLTGITVTVDSDRIATLLIDQPGARVNVMDTAFLDDLERAVGSLGRDLRGVIITSAKENNFVAGADLRQLAMAPSAEDASGQVRRLQRTLNRLEALPFPSVAAINGAALGGGFELALACDYRVCIESDASILGLPEVQLGLLPAGGGCQRLPQLVGLSRALGLILQSRRFSPRRARRYGAVDVVVHPAVLMEAARQMLARGKRDGHPTWSRLDRAAARWPAVRTMIYRQAERSVRARTHDHYPAPFRALDAVRAGVEQGTGAGQAAEAVAFGDLAVGPIARNLIHLFLATEALKREQRKTSSPDSRASATLRPRLGVVGAGFMGAGIAQAAAAGGFDVRVRDVQPDQVARGLRTARKLTRSAARKGRFSRPEARAIESRLSGSVDYSGFARANLVIEAVFEDVATKRAVIKELESVVSPQAVIASNTSSLPIARVAADAAHPERIIGMHFFSPVHKMPLLEVVRPDGASDEAIRVAVSVGRSIGKTVIVVGDGPGFYTTRVLSMMVQEAGRLFEQGASIEAIDRAMTAFGFPVGPLALTDEVGIEVGAHISSILHAAFPDRFTSGELLQRMVDQGRLGRKSKLGFYDYRGRRKKPDVAVYGLRSATPAHMPAHFIQRRLVLALVNEAARCLEAGIIESPRDGDVGAVLGFGFPPFLGGPFRYVDSLGAASVVQELRQFEYGYGEVYRPSPILVERATRNERFYGDLEA